MNKISIRFFDDREVRAVWDDESSKWWFSVLDIISVLRNIDDYEKNRNYWKYLKAKLKREHHQLGSVTTQFKFIAPDGKKRSANVLDNNGIIEKINDREVLMKGVDYSYYYEQENEVAESDSGNKDDDK
jgi:cell filamentation protein